MKSKRVGWMILTAALTLALFVPLVAQLTTASLEGIVRDPTGAGDSFAGGFMGYIASQGEVTRNVLKHAMFYGSVMGSFSVERFGTERLHSLSREEIDERFSTFRELTHLD